LYASEHPVFLGLHHGVLLVRFMIMPLQHPSARAQMCTLGAQTGTVILLGWTARSTRSACAPSILQDTTDHF
jgi:hypothetical protein